MLVGTVVRSAIQAGELSYHRGMLIMRPPDFWVYAYLYGDELQLFARSTVLYPVESSASSIMLKPKSQLCLKGYGCRSTPIPEQGNIFLDFIFASDFHLQKDTQSRRA